MLTNFIQFYSNVLVLPNYTYTLGGHYIVVAPTHPLNGDGKKGVVCYHCFDIFIEFYRQCFGATQLHVRSCWQLGCGGPYPPVKWGR